MTDITENIRLAKEATVRMSNIPTESKLAALSNMADRLDAARPQIIEANAKDLDAVRDKIPAPMYKRMIVNDAKVDEMIAIIRSVSELKDPVGEVMDTTEMDEGLTLYQIRCPVGLLGVVFESRPDVVPQIMSLCIMSGNCVAFKGGSEATHTIRALFDVLREAASEHGIPKEAFVLMESREDIASILELDQYIDLLIPRGSNSFVRYIQDNTRIPVMGHASGICSLYVDAECDIEKALAVALDSKIQYPAACNAVENLLVNRKIAKDFIPRMVETYSENGVEVRGSQDIISICDSVKPATEEDWDTEYNDLIISIRTVDSVIEAVDFINAHGSHHTDAIITSNEANAKVFAGLVDSADVFVNASTRFADGFRFGKGAEVGISTNKIHARGPVGMEGLMIYKYVLVGDGQVVKDYAGKDARPFTHRHIAGRYPY